MNQHYQREGRKQQKQRQKHCHEEIKDDDVVGCVQGFLAMPDSKKPHLYSITAGEIKRRLDYPEFFKKNALSAYLRCRQDSAQSANLFSRLQTQISKKGTSNVNLISKICEGEANDLARSTAGVNLMYFPTNEIPEMAFGDVFSTLPSGDHKAKCDNILTEVSAAR